MGSTPEKRPGQKGVMQQELRDPPEPGRALLGMDGTPGKAEEGVGGHEHGPRQGRAPGCITELGWQEFILQQVKGCADSNNDSKNTENNHKYLFG